MEVTQVKAGPINASAPSSRSASPGSDPVSSEALWRKAGAAGYGLSCDEFAEVLFAVGESTNYGFPNSQAASRSQQVAFLAKLRLSELALARACARGKTEAWEQFFALYRYPLIRAAVKITRNDTLGHDLAEELYADLYGLDTRDGSRKSPLNSYIGSGTLAGWLSALLVQRNIQRYRRTHRETPLDDYDAAAPPCESVVSDNILALLQEALNRSLERLDSEERYLLRAYYSDRRTYNQIGQLLDKNQSTIKRRIDRLTAKLGKQVLHRLQVLGLSKEEARDALGTDPRDLEINLTKLLQNPEPGGVKRD